MAAAPQARQSGFKTNPDYKIAFEPSPRRVRVAFAGETIADSGSVGATFQLAAKLGAGCSGGVEKTSLIPLVSEEGRARPHMDATDKSAAGGLSFAFRQANGPGSLQSLILWGSTESARHRGARWEQTTQAAAKSSRSSIWC